MYITLMNIVDAVAAYQLTSIASGIVFFATVHPVVRNGKPSHDIAWTANGVPCAHHIVPAPIENAVRDAFASGVYAAAFNGVDRI